ncbi:hypothetical protein G5S52_12380 [Grimontia sp. S25]|uniref:Lipoprotein n=1 Tax=Grimontia sedimenti TaxID=2711294 RepID=A0A6M1RDM3_9GAMM|nr:hypothetical protein [Grimontia sedimenti]NGN98416.1 hypothetical protein [Grimontia sedimenti]
MNVKSLIVSIVLSFSLLGCQSKKLNTAVIDASEYSVDGTLLTKYSNLVVTDELEGRFYYTGSDFDDWLLGEAYRKINFTYHPDSGENTILTDVRTMQLNWIHADSVTIFVGKEKIVANWKEGRYTNTSIVDGGSLGNTVYTHEHFKIPLSMRDAKKIATASPGTVTIRFYGEQGYVDEKIHPMTSWENLLGVINLAENTKLK